MERATQTRMHGRGGGAIGFKTHGTCTGTRYGPVTLTCLTHCLACTVLGFRHDFALEDAILVFYWTCPFSSG
jgi:hypothetical protein